MRQTGILAQTTTQMSIRLFGQIDVQQNRMPIPRPRTRKELWLLALLVLRHRASLDRKWLATTLWFDSDETQALRNLRRSLSNLREVLGTEAFRLFAPTPRTISLDLSGASCDVNEFDALIARGDVTSLANAVELYRGPLLAECSEEWAIPERDARERAYLDALEALAAHATASQDSARGVRVLRRIVAADPFRETAQCALMTALSASGDRAGAMLVYRQFRLRLHEELQSEPEAETTALYQRLRDTVRLPAANAGRHIGSQGVSSSKPNPHLPRPLTGLVGRKRELEEIAAHLLRTRLLTLTGVGGVGKTRLALAAAERTLPDFADGVWFVDLAPLADSALVAAAVATKLGLREDPRRALSETLTEYLSPKHLLLLMDNCEHLLPGCAQFVDRLLQGCPHLRILATSRQALGLRGEITWRVPSLSLPTAKEGSEPSASMQPLILALLESDAVRLFLERAMEASTSFALTERNARAVTQICLRLDGIPLALELAAARARVLSAEQIAKRLGRVFTLLTGGSSADLPRHQTLRALLDWSYALLNNQEKALLCRLSVFAGGWTLEAAEAVGVGANVEDSEILDLLTSLVDKSLVVAEPQEEETRYRLLETVRQYAQERLGEREDYTRVQEQHQAFFLAFAENGSLQMEGQQQVIQLDRLEVEHDNLRKALEGENKEWAMRIAVALFWFWNVRGYHREGRKWLADTLASSVTQASAPIRAKALNAAGGLAQAQGDFEAARSYFQQSLTLFQELKHKMGIANAFMNLGIVARVQGDYTASRSLYEQSLTQFQELGKKENIANALRNLGELVSVQGDHAAARALLEQSLVLSQELGDKRNSTYSLLGLGAVAYEQGDHTAARSFFERSLPLFQALGDKQGIAHAFSNLSAVAYLQEDYAASHSLYKQSLTLFQELGNKHGIVYSLEGFAALASVLQEPSRRAPLLWGIAEAMRETLGAPLSASERFDYDKQVAQVRSVMNPDVFAAAWAEGRAMTMEQGIVFALAESKAQSDP